MLRTTRRGALLGGAAMALAAAGTYLSLRPQATRAAQAKSGEETFEVTHTEAEWRQLLSPEAFAVLRQHSTERPGTSPLDAEERPGTYACAGCALPVYSSTTKYHSGTGWPSFWQPIDNAVRTASDNTLFMTRTEVHCRRCGGHLGHVFDDGPQPTGMRYCMNGVAMGFTPSAGAAS